jgi:hypothetical protein
VSGGAGIDRVLVLLAVLAAVTTGGALGSTRHADAPTASAAETSRQRAITAGALELVSGRPADLGYRLVIAPPRRRVRGVTDRGRRTITLFVGDHEVPHMLAHDLAHELGHAFDDRRMTDRMRRAYLRRRGRPASQWWPRGRFSDYATGAGDFAEVFALCHAASPEFRSRLAPRPRDPCALLPASARVHGERR